ncbi:MAG: hypothetical protein MUC66_03155 [Methanolinea sp.]|nr:hypothetical protein [Methanolinea sp.]
MTGWGRGRCRAYGIPLASQGQAPPAGAQEPVAQVPAQGSTAHVQQTYNPPVLCGLGRGGIPWGCGRGFGGGRRRRCLW